MPKRSGDRKNKRCFTRNFQRHLNEYCANTSIHGLKYLGGKRRWFEKAWWGVLLLLSSSCCVFFIWCLYAKWKSSPVLVSFANRETPIYELPFPAVTICPETKMKRRSINWTQILNKLRDNITLNDAEAKAYRHYSMICDQNFTFKMDMELSITESSEDFFKYIINNTPDFLNLTIYCSWLLDEKSCFHYFTPIITDEGLCYTFNMLDRDDFFNSGVKRFGDLHNVNIKVSGWDPLTFSYMDEEGAFSYPFRAYLPGAKVAFSVTLATLAEDIEYMCKDYLQGYRVLLHHPADIPRPSKQFFWLPLDQSVMAAITPETITTSGALRSHRPEVRRCYFGQERRLKFFQVYTQDNCELECTANFTQLLCNCTAFYVPRDGRSPICGPGSLTCLQEVEVLQMQADLASSPFKSSLRENLVEVLPETVDSRCNCLPECSSIEYRVEISQSPWDWKKQFQEFRFNPQSETGNMHVSSLDIFFKKSQIIGLERHELYGPLDFVASFGGVLGLFTGFSIVSLVEIVYFLTVRFLGSQ